VVCSCGTKGRASLGNRGRGGDGQEEVAGAEVAEAGAEVVEAVAEVMGKCKGLLQGQK